MRKILVLMGLLGWLLLALWLTDALAACVTTTYFLPGGGMMTCMTCCYEGGNCTVFCF